MKVDKVQNGIKLLSLRLMMLRKITLIAKFGMKILLIMNQLEITSLKFHLFVLMEDRNNGLKFIQLTEAWMLLESFL